MKFCIPFLFCATRHTTHTLQSHDKHGRLNFREWLLFVCKLMIAEWKEARLAPGVWTLRWEFSWSDIISSKASDQRAAVKKQYHRQQRRPLSSLKQTCATLHFLGLNSACFSADSRKETCKVTFGFSDSLVNRKNNEEKKKKVYLPMSQTSTPWLGLGPGGEIAGARSQGWGLLSRRGAEGQLSWWGKRAACGSCRRCCTSETFWREVPI